MKRFFSRCWALKKVGYDDARATVWRYRTELAATRAAEKLNAKVVTSVYYAEKTHTCGNREASDG